MSGMVRCPRGYGEIRFCSMTKSPHIVGNKLMPYQDERCPVSDSQNCGTCHIAKRSGRVGIGGSMFVYNATKYDYCMKEAIESLLAFCDEVAVLDCGSTDDTIPILESMSVKYKNLHIYTGGDWNCAPGRERLSMLANQAKSNLNTDWHFMLQADEVVHEASIPFIKEAIGGGLAPGFRVRRWNLYGDSSHCIRLDSKSKPCGDNPIRLAAINYNALDDAESLSAERSSPAYEDRIVIVHYGLVRRGSALIDKCIDMQKWFFGEPDRRLKTSQAEGVFTATDFTPETEYMPLPCSHPVYMKQWLDDRQNDKTKRIKR